MKLGETQLGVLAMLNQFGFYEAGRSGWVWDTRSGTERICESLIKHGLVSTRERAAGLSVRYVITPKGRKEYAAQLRAAVKEK